MAYLADLKAGHPERQHRDLRIKEAKLYLSAAEAQHRRTPVDPTASDWDRESAKAEVITWTERLQALQR